MPKTTSGFGASREKPVIFRALLWLFLFVTLVSLIDVPLVVPSVSLDSSWEAAMQYFAIRRFQAAQDYVFTYGPLGFLEVELYNKTLFLLKIVYELLFKGFLLFQIEHLFNLCRVSLPRKLLFYAGLILMANAVTRQDVFKNEVCDFLLFPLLILVAAVEPRPPIWRSLATSLLFVVLIFGKANVLPVVLAVLLFLTIRHLKEKRHFLCSPAFLFAVLYPLIWIACGQHVRNIPLYIWNSWQIAAGYNDSMSLPIPSDYAWTEQFAWVNLAVVPLLIYIALISLKTGPSERRSWAAGAAAVIASVLLTVYKTGFTRADEHIIIFFYFTILLVALIVTVARVDGWPQRTLAGTMSLIGIVDVLAVSAFFVRPASNALPPVFLTLSDLLSPRACIAALDRGEAAAKAALDMPNYRRIIDRQSVDIWPSEQQVVLLNNLNYRPRPVFQGYSAYNSYTAALNAGYLDGRYAPDFVIFGFSAVDGRYPFQEDGVALRSLLRHYRPVEVADTNTQESHYLLLRHVESPGPPVTVLRHWSLENVRYDQNIMLPQLANPRDWMVIRVSVKRTLLGRLVSLLHGTRAIYLILGDTNGRGRKGRLVIGTAGEGFVLNPMLSDNSSVLALYQKDGIRSDVRQMYFTTETPGRYFVDSIDITAEETAPGIASVADEAGAHSP